MKKLAILVISLLILASPTTFANHGHQEGSGYSLEDKYFGKVHFLFKNKAELGPLQEMHQLYLKDQSEAFLEHHKTLKRILTDALRLKEAQGHQHSSFINAESNA